MTPGRYLAAMALAMSTACTTVDPGPNFVIPEETFNADFYFCHVEPEVIYAKKCGDETAGSCHFNSSAVPGMALINHPVVDCGGGDKPVNASDVAVGTGARANFTSVSLEMSRDYQTAPFYVRPLCAQDGSCPSKEGHSHPRGLFSTSDPAVSVIKAWAQKP